MNTILPLFRMRGLRLVWDPVYGRADLGLANGALDTTHLLETMIIISLFSDRRAEPSDVLPYGQTDPRGWCGDSYAGVPGFLLGSRLWLLQGARATATLPKTARGYIVEALQWMITDEVAQSVDAQCFYSPLNNRQLDCLVSIRQPRVVANDDFSFVNIWREELGMAA